MNSTLSLAQYFFKPSVIESDEIFDGLLRGMATQTSQKMDTSIVADVSFHHDCILASRFCIVRHLQYSEHIKKLL